MIERRIHRGLSHQSEVELWVRLDLSTEELDDFLDFVEERAADDFVYSMCVMAAHTGARRSELCRSRQEDIDFDAGTLLIREKNRVRGMPKRYRHLFPNSQRREIERVFGADTT